mmetsp:Transcript_22460/g.66214  ORF Transcript_22460/g.66214 Transcript_22460/m.66214 type:complete len:490 (+) Transcript_22460:54-1523(+)
MPPSRPQRRPHATPGPYDNNIRRSSLAADSIYQCLQDEEERAEAEEHAGGDDAGGDGDGPPPATRTTWGSQAYVDLFDVIFSSTFSPRRFRDWMRMSRETFDALTDRLSSTQTYRAIFNPDGSPIHPQRKTTVQREVAISIYALSGNEPFSRIAVLWGRGARSSGAIHVILRRFVQAVEEMFNEWVNLPSTAEHAQDVTAAFEALRGLPAVLAAIDGTHFEVPGNKDLPGQGSSLQSYKKRNTIILQALVDAAGMFMHIVSGFPGRCNDARCLAESGLIPQILPRLMDPNYPGNYIIGDSGYPLKSFLIRGYAYSTTDPKEQVFNAYLSSTRTPVENAFGRLKARFRRLRWLNCGYEWAPRIINACCVLHNFIQYHDGADNASQPLTQRDDVRERSDVRTSTRPRAYRRDPRDAAAVTVAAAAVQLQGGESVDVSKEAGDEVREILKNLTWRIHLHRRENRAVLFGEHLARLSNDDGADEDVMSDPDDY